MARDPKKPDPNEASDSYSGTGQAKDGRQEERREKGVYGSDAESGPGYEREDEQKGGRYGVARTVDRRDGEGSSEAGPDAAGSVDAVDGTGGTDGTGRKDPTP